MYITLGLTLLVVVTLVYKENPWRWWLRIKTCRFVIRIKVTRSNIGHLLIKQK